MGRLLLVVHHVAVLTVLASLAVPCAQAVTIEMVTVGDPGNAADPATGNQRGAVGYEYQIGKYEVTIQQYATFLNAVDPNGTNTYGLYNERLASSWHSFAVGISLSAQRAAGMKYTVVESGGGSGRQPIASVGWFAAARFANWMHNGQPTGLLNPSTEDGAYTLNGAMNGALPAKNAGARFYIPTVNEWHKAAYYSPLLNSGSGGYYIYATQSNVMPGNEIGDKPNQANYWNPATYGFGGKGFAVTQSEELFWGTNPLTDVGAFSNSASHYGTFDQNGNVGELAISESWPAEWYEGQEGFVWGGAYFLDFWVLQSSYGMVPGGSYYSGFRLASPISDVPEINASGLSAAIWLIAGFVQFLDRRRRI